MQTLGHARSQLSNVLHFPVFLEGMNNDSGKAWVR